MMRASHAVPCLTLVALLSQACGEATSAEPCASSGAADLTITMTGAPAGSTPAVELLLPGGAITDVSGSQTLTGLPGGLYTIRPRGITVPDSIISGIRTATVAGGPTFCLRDGQARSATVTWAPNPAGGRLWYGAGFYTLGFTPAQLGTSATVAPTVTLGTRGGSGVTFDRNGNLWVRGQTATDPVLMRYPAASLASTGTPVPDRVIGIFGLDCVSPGSLAFDPAGNLWMSLGCQGRVVRLTPAQYAVSGTASPTVQISNLVNPQGLAFDGAGNLWVGDQTQLKRFDAARLTANVSAAADLAVTFTTPTPPAPGQTALQAVHLAFAPDGEFWVGSPTERALWRVEPAVRAATGTQGATPTRIVYLDALTLPKGFAFDNAGGLFVGSTQAAFVRLAPAQLDANSTPAAPTVPQRSFASGNILGFGDDIAIFPAPPTTPLYHRAP